MKGMEYTMCIMKEMMLNRAKRMFYQLMKNAMKRMGSYKPST